MKNLRCPNNLCFDCDNCFADKCEYIRLGKPTIKQKIRKGCFGNIVEECDDFSFDKNSTSYCTAGQVAKLLNMSITKFYNTDFEFIKSLCYKKGYKLLKENISFETVYYLRGFRKC